MILGQAAFRRDAGRQSGAALIMCLLLLSALCLLGLSAASEHHMQVRMSENLDSGLARRFEAQHALDWAEAWLLGLPGAERPLVCQAECSPPDIIRQEGAFGPAPEHQDLDWWRHNGHAAGYLPGNEPSGFGGPWYLIEQVHLESSTDPEPLQPETAYYRILARGSSASGSQNSVIEAVLARPWGHESLSNGFPPTPGTASFCMTEPVKPPCGRVAWRLRRS